MKRLFGKVCVITGASGGIGFAAVQRFLQEGAHVVMSDINEAGIQARRAELHTDYAETRFRTFRCDVRDERQVEDMIRFAKYEFGGIDCLFNNAGVGGAYGPLIGTRMNDWDRTVEIILRGTFLGTKHAAIAMIQGEKGGSIINNASIAAHVGDSGGAAYSAAKAGVLALTRCAALELAPYCIRVNSLSPGTILTSLLHRGTPTDGLQRAALDSQPWPEIEDGRNVAGTAAYLASNDARFITGADVMVDGGVAAAGPGFVVSEGARRRQAGGLMAADWSH